MKRILWIVISCLCLSGCRKSQFPNSVSVSVHSEKNTAFEIPNPTVTTDFTEDKAETADIDSIGQTKVKNRTVTNFQNSLTEEKYRNAYKDLILSLWEKNDFIARNYDTIEGMHKYYKSNESFACTTIFVNNELLSDIPLKIGMTKDDVLKLLGHPERSVAEEKNEIIDYFLNMYVSKRNVSEWVLDASTAAEFFFDENKVITKIIIVVEGSEVPVDYMNWEE